jgi:hypothetical protein
MSGSTRLLVIILGAVVVIAAAAGIAIYLQGGQETAPPGPLATPGAWPASERQAFIASCVKSCRSSPGVTADRYPLCDQACKCSADEAEKLVTAEELVEIYKAMQGGTASKDQNDKVEKMKAAGIACVPQVTK